MFSVLMSVYEKDDLFFFQEAIDSILAQTVLPSEIVIVCDGPLNKEYYTEIYKSQKVFLSLDIKFLLVKLESNVGLGLALKEGVGYCTQEYIIRMDSDDLSRKDRIEKTKSYINNNPCIDVFGSHIEEFNYERGDLNRFRKVPLSKKEIISFCKKRNPMNHVTICMRRETILSVGNYESVLFHEDYYLWVKAIMSGVNIGNIDSILVDVRVGNDLIGRRHGVSYLKCEHNFAIKCLDMGFFSRFDAIRYLLPRSFLRLLPKIALSIIYKRLRA